MTEERIDGPKAHPTEERLISRLDEPGAPGGEDVEGHLAACAECRRRVAEIETVLTALRVRPEAPEPAALATQRERVLAALPDRGARRSVRLASWRRVRWAPVLAAAALAGILLFGPAGRERAPETGPGLVDAGATADGTPSAVAAEAERAADEVFVAATGEEPGVDEAPGVDIDPSAVATLEALERTTADPLSIDAVEYVELTEEFAELSADDQAAILSELETMTFDLSR